MIPKVVIQQVIESQKERLSQMDTGLARQMLGFNTQSTNAFIVSGIRRSGKSTWLQQTYRNITDPAIFINFEDPRLAGFDLEDFNRLHEIAVEKNCNIYFFDEIQNIPKWESFVRFRLDEGYKIFLTGSNASMLSKELGTKLTGRHLTKEMFPFSFAEFTAFYNLASDEESAYAYLSNGGFPEYLKTKNPDTLTNLFNDIIIRDIAVRYNIRNNVLLVQLGEWLISNTGKLFTANSLRKIITINSSSTMMEYLSYFTDSYLFFFVPKFSYSYKVQLINSKKIYCIDNGLVKNLAISFSDDLGRLLENMVFMHLRRNFTEIYYFAERKECDFVVFKNRQIQFLCQVCWKLDSTNMDRELTGLMEALTFFGLKKGFIVSHAQRDSFMKGDCSILVIPYFEWVEMDLTNMNCLQKQED